MYIAPWKPKDYNVLSKLLRTKMNTTTPPITRATALNSASTVLLAWFIMAGAAAQEAKSVAIPPVEAVEAVEAVAPARVRLFGQNGAMVSFYQNSTCIGGNATKTMVSGSLGDVFSSFLGRAKNTSIGMTETPTTIAIADRDGYFSKAYFREYEVPGNKPVTLEMAFQSAAGAPGSQYCSKLGATFTPEAGKEYEVALDVRSGQCLAAVREIQKSEQGPASLRDVKTDPTYKCK